MQRDGWYLIAYDIANPRRLCKVHRFIKKKALVVQKSVFLGQGNRTHMEGILDETVELMKLAEDDLKAYPIIGPSEIWTIGINPFTALPLIRPAAPKKAKTTSHRKQGGWLKNLLKIKTKKKGG